MAQLGNKVSWDEIQLFQRISLVDYSVVSIKSYNIVLDNYVPPHLVLAIVFLGVSEDSIA